MRRHAFVPLGLSFVVVSFCLVVSEVLAGPAGAPLKGVDVKLGRNPGGTLMRTVKTDDRGVVELGVLPRGSYCLSFQTPEERAVMRTDTGEDTSPELVIVSVEISGTPNGPTVYTYNRKSGSIVLHDRSEASRTSDSEAKAAKGGKKSVPETMSFESDGAHAIQATIVKSKSNITNN